MSPRQERRYGAAPRRRRPSPWVGRLLVVLLVAMLAPAAVGGCSAGSPHGGSSGGAVSARGSASTAPTSAPADGVERRAAVSGLVARRAAALGRRVKGPWLATLADPASPFAVAQSALFDRMLRLPIGRYTGQEVEVGGPLDPARQEQYGADAWLASVTVAYQLAGYDRGLRRVTTSYVVASTPGGWRLADVDDPGPAQPWDLSPLTVLRSASTLVVGNAPAATLRAYLAVADAARTRIAAVWGTAVPAVVVAARDARGFVSQLHREGDAGLDQVAATTDGPLEGGQVATTDRVYVNPTAFAGLTDAGRRQVLTHELTHVTVRATTPGTVPMWLSEGFADHLGYATVDLPARTIAAPLLAEVRAGRGPTRLPSDADFDPASGAIGPAYTQAWLAVGRMAARYGDSQVVAFYHAVAGGTAAGAGDPATDAATKAARAFPAVLGVSEEAFTADWLASIPAIAR